LLVFNVCAELNILPPADEDGFIQKLNVQVLAFPITGNVLFKKAESPELNRRLRLI
jgi:hypothetical protein